MAGFMASRNFFAVLKTSSLRSVGRVYNMYTKSLTLTPRGTATLNCRYATTQYESREVARGERSQPSRVQSLSKLISDMEESVRKFGRVNTVHFHDAMEKFTSQKEVSAAEAMLLLRCCGELMPQEMPTNRKVFADTLWSKIEKKGMTLDTSHYNALLKVYLENENDFSPLEFLSMIQGKGIEPNRVTYQRLVHRYCQSGDIEAATKILEHMKEKGLHINEHIFYALMLGYSRAGDIKSSSGVLDMMTQSGLDLTVDSYLALALAQAEQGAIESVLETIAMAEQKQQSMNDQDYLDIIFSLASKGHTQHVPQMLSKMKKDWGYNQDCKNMIYKLINCGCDETSYMVYKTMSLAINDDERMNGGSGGNSYATPGAFYIRHLIKCKRSSSQILEFAESISPHLKNTALMFAIEENHSLAFDLMKILSEKSTDFSVKPHYFWPMFRMVRKHGTKQDVFTIIKQMNEMSVTITLATVADYIIPALVNRKLSVTNIIDELDEVQIKRFDTVNGMVQFHVNNMEVKEAADLLNAQPTRIVPSLSHSILVAASNSDAILFDDIALILGQMRFRYRQNLDEASHESNLPSEEYAQERDEPDVVGRFLIDFIRRKRGRNVQEMMEAIEKRGLSIYQDSAAAIKSALKNSCDEELSALVDRLASGDLQRVNLNRHTTANRINRSNDNQRLEELENIYESRKSRNLESDRLEVNLLILYAKSGHVDKAENLYKAYMSKENPAIGIGASVLLMDMYTEADMLDKAREMYSSIQNSYSSASISKVKILKLASLMYKQGLVQEALELLENNGDKKTTQNAEEYNDLDTSKVKDEEGIHFHNISEIISIKLLGIPSSTGDVEAFETLRDALYKGEYLKQSPKSEGKKIEVFCNKGDLESAFNLMKEIKEKYNVIVYKNNLIKEYIRTEDSEKLQEIWKMTSDIHGEANALFDLSFAFIEEGKLPQAKKLLETRGLRLREGRLNYWCQNLQDNNKVKFLEDFLAISSELVLSDRRLVCYNLFKTYAAGNDTNKALDLWTKMQEEDILPTDYFLYELGHFLLKNEVTPPFEIPVITQINSSNKKENFVFKPTSDVRQQHSDEEVTPPHVAEFQEMLENGKLDDAMEIYRKSLSDPLLKLYNRHSLELVNKLMESNRLKDATDLVEENPRYTGESFKRLTTLSYLLKKLTENGEFDKIKGFMDDSPMKEKHGFTMPLSRAAVKSNRTDECFDLFLSFNETEESNKILSPPAMFFLLQNSPSLLTKITNKLDILNENGRTRMTSVLWAHHFCNTNTDESKQLLNELRRSESYLPHSCVCLKARETGSISLLTEFIKVMDENPKMTSKFAKSSVYSSWIDILLYANKVEEAVNVLKSCKKDIDVSQYTLNKLKAAAVQHNVEFPLTGNTQHIRTIASSSSSSDFE